MKPLFASALLFTALAQPSLAAPFEMPLAPGYYVIESEDCALAYDATLALVHDKGINTPELLCEFQAVTDDGNGVWEFAGDCEQVEQRQPYLNEGRITITAENFFLFNDGVIEGAYRYCAPETLPPPYGTFAG